MRHPFWKWTGWLSIGLTGCLHGQDWRAAVSKPLTRTVADRRESRPVPKVVGPLRNASPKFAPPAEVAAQPAFTAQPVAIKRVPQLPPEVSLPSAAQPEERSRKSLVTPVGHAVSATLPQTVVQAASAETPQSVRPSPVTPPLVVEAPPRTGPFAEFERAIPMRQSVVTSLATPQAEPAEVIVVEQRKSEPSTALPIITPAGAIISAKPVATQSSRSESSKPEDSPLDDRPCGLFSNSAVPAKELSDVTEITAVPAKDLIRAEAGLSVRPQDVSVLVEQVFEDLRQRRLNDARQRTAWLKQLVKQRAPASPAKVLGEEVPAASDGERSDGERSVEPRRLESDPQATAVEKSAPETFFDDDESTKGK